MKVLVMNCSPVRAGATACITDIVTEQLSSRAEVRSVCIDDFSIALCKGCRSCHHTARCVIDDDARKVMKLYEWAEVIISVAPSYWADVPGQFKVFIDRCTPWCDTHEPYARLSDGKRGYTIALRTGPSMRECEQIFRTVEHFYGHLHIACSGSLGLCSVESRQDALARKDEIIAFCAEIQ